MIHGRNMVVNAVVATVFACGLPACRGAPNETPAPVSSTAATEEHHEAPHGGALVALGEDVAQVELAVDRAAGAATIYVFNGEAEESVRIPQAIVSLALSAPPALAGRRFNLAARASVLTGEVVGDSSEFTLTDAALRGVASLKGQIVEITVKGQTFRNIRVEYSSGLN